MKNQKIWDWYHKNDNTIQAILAFACEFIPGGNIAKNTLDLLLARFDDKEENEDLESFIEETEPTLRELINAIEKLNKNHQNLPIESIKSLLEENLKEEFHDALVQLNQTITQSFCQHNPQNSQIINGRYKLIKSIGKGGQGEVYLAWHLEANHQVAIKLLPRDLSDDENAILELQTEYGLLVDKLRHSHIVAYTDLGKDKQSQCYFLVMDYIEGKSLRYLLLQHRHTPFSLKEAVELLYPIAKALDFAHANGVVHCDIKPENILIRDKDKQVFLTDFGLASKIRNTTTQKQTNNLIAETDQKQVNNLRGTLPYMAPEQYCGKNLIAETDTWALGIILYELLAGYHPYQGHSFEHYSQLICSQKVEEIDNLSPKVWKIIKKMLIKDKRKRPFVLVPLFKKLRKLAKPKLKRVILSLFLIFCIGTGGYLISFQKPSDKELYINSVNNEIEEQPKEESDPNKQNQLGLYYIDRDNIKAVYWFRTAAEQGNADGQSNLGIMYKTGKGVPQDYKKSVKWLHKAAEQGLASGQANLGYMYLNGEGALQDYKKAIYWFRKAKQQGSAQGQTNLGYMYENGKGVPKDKKRALYYYKKAAIQGNSYAKSALKRLLRNF